MKVRLDSSAGDADQKRGHQHLAYGDDIPRNGSTGPRAGQPDGEKADCATQKDCGPHVNVNRTGLSYPGIGRDQQRHRNRGDPLENHQPRKQLIGVAINLLLLLLEQFI